MLATEEVFLYLMTEESFDARLAEIKRDPESQRLFKITSFFHSRAKITLTDGLMITVKILLEKLKRK